MTDPMSNGPTVRCLASNPVAFELGRLAQMNALFADMVAALRTDRFWEIKARFDELAASTGDV